MGGNAVLGKVMHLKGADLHFQRDAAFAHHCGVQGLVHVLLWRGDVVIKLSRHRVPELVDHSQRVVAIGVGVNQDADSVEVIYLVELFALGGVLLDLSIDAVDALRASVQVCRDSGCLQRHPQRLALSIQIRFTLHTPCGQPAGDVLVLHRVDSTEGQVFQLPLDVPHTQPVGQR